MYNNPYQSENSSDIEKGKTIAIVSYITIIGWLIALIMYQQNKSKFAAHHLRQALGLFAAAFVLGLAISILGFILPFTFALQPIVSVAAIVFMIMGIVNASNGKDTTLPFIGDYAAEWFRNIP